MSEPVSNEVKFSPSAGDGSEDEDYSSLSAALRQRRASERRSRKGRARRPSSPFPDDAACRQRRRSSVFTISSGETAISMEEGQPAVVSQEQIFEHKEVLGSVKQQPLEMRRKLKIVHQAKGYIKRHEGQLQERLAQSKSTRDIYVRFNILLTTKWQQLKREAANTSNLLIPWELRIKEIESHFGSVVASYFTFLRWLFWVNLVIGFILLVFVIVPEYLTANPQHDGERKIIMDEEKRNATNLLTLWEFEGVLKCSAIFYGYYSNIERPEYRMPLAYFLTGLVVYIYSFVAILRKMAENSRMSKLSEKEDECIFSWKLFTGWDFMIGNTETAHNRIASVTLGFKEALLEEAEKKKDLRNWRIISLRALVNICVMILLAVSAYAVVTVVSRTDDNSKLHNWWRENETTIVVTVISISFPVFFELLGLLEHYHPRKQLRLQLARIMLLNLLNLYSLIFALFSKIEGMSKELDSLKPPLDMNVGIISDNLLNESLVLNMTRTCTEIKIPCTQCDMALLSSPIRYVSEAPTTSSTDSIVFAEESMFNLDYLSQGAPLINVTPLISKPVNIEVQLKKNKNIDNRDDDLETTTLDSVSLALREMERLRNISKINSIMLIDESLDETDNKSEVYDEDYSFDVLTSETTTVLLETDLENEITSSVDFYTTDDFDINQVTVDMVTTDISSSTTDPYEAESPFGSETSRTSTTDYLYTSDTASTERDSTVDSTTQFSEYSPTADHSTMRKTNILTTDYIGLKSTYVPLNIPINNTKKPITNVTTTPIIITTYDEEFNDKTTTLSHGTSITYADVTIPTESTTITILHPVTICPNLSFNCTVNCGGLNITQVFTMSNCTVVNQSCYIKQCVEVNNTTHESKYNQTNVTLVDVAYVDEYNRKMYNLTTATKKKLLKLCWETMFGQELIKLTMMDLVFVLLGTLFMDFFRALFVRYMNRCWCWDLEKKFPEYGDFKIAENILHLINNQGMVWMGMFFSPGLVVLNVVKLMIMMYLRSWAVMTCNVPHEVVFRVSKSNNFYLALLLTMLFLCVLPVGYTIVWVKPSWHCGPFSEYEKIYYILTSNIYKILPKSLNFALEYIASPAIVIPLLVLLILIIYYLTSLTNSLREANNDLKIQLRRERTEERRKMFRIADTRRRVGSSAMDNTPFAKWKRALPSLPLSKSIDSDERKSGPSDEKKDSKPKTKGGGIFAKIVGMALDKKTDVEAVSEIENGESQSSNNVDYETDTDFHESLPREVLKKKDITIYPVSRVSESRKKSNVEFKTQDSEKSKPNAESNKLCVTLEKLDDKTEKKAIMEKHLKDILYERSPGDIKSGNTQLDERSRKKMTKKQTSDSSTHSRQSDSLGSVIPVITISTTESDEEVLQGSKEKIGHSSHKSIKDNIRKDSSEEKNIKKYTKGSSDLKSLRRQSSVDSIKEYKDSKETKPEEGHKYQYSL